MAWIRYDPGLDDRPSSPTSPGIGIAWSGLVLLAGILWLVTVDEARAMGVGPGTMGMALPLFVGMWVAMMGAMMLPSIAPSTIGSVAGERSALAARADATGIAAHVVGFFLPWAAYGVLAFTALLGTQHLLDASPTVARWLGVGIFAVTGLYQLSPAKRACMAHCRMRMSQHGPGVAGAFRTGIRHGAYCVGCCWALMTIMFAVGVMNIPAMIGLAAVIFLEKVWRHGVLLSRVAGIAFLALAIVAAVHPAFLGGLYLTGSDAMAAGAQMRGM